MKYTTEEIIEMVSKSYAQKFDGIDVRDLAQEIRLKIMHGKQNTYDPTRGEFEPYARAIANRTAHAYVYAQRSPVHGRTADFKRWKNARAVIISSSSEDENGNRFDACDPPSLDRNVDEVLWSQDVVDCLQQIFEEHAEDGRLARGILLENRPAGEIAEENNVPEWRVYRATFRIRRAIKTHPRARLLWETR